MKYIPLCLGLASGLFCTTTFAADGDAPKWSGEGELGYTVTSGNSETESLSTKLGIDYQNASWGNELDVEALQAESETLDVSTANPNDTITQETANRYTVTNKLTYDLGEAFYNFLNVRYEEDQFSSYDYQSNVTAGLGWHAVKTEFTVLDFEIGAGHKKDKVDATGEIEEGTISRFYESFSYEISDSATFTQSLLTEGNSDNRYSELNAGLRLAIKGDLALKLSHTVKHNSDVDANSSEYDRITGVTLVYGF